jgi:hypothetical protein
MENRAENRSKVFVITGMSVPRRTVRACDSTSPRTWPD